MEERGGVWRRVKERGGEWRRVKESGGEGRGGEERGGEERRGEERGGEGRRGKGRRGKESGGGGGEYLYMANILTCVIKCDVMNGSMQDCRRTPIMLVSCNIYEECYYDTYYT